MDKIIDFASSGFWPFVGVWLFTLSFSIVALNFLLSFWSRFTRIRMVRKHGWPPAHLDADGDWKPKEKLEN